MSQSPAPVPGQPGGTKLVIAALVIALVAVVLVNLYIEMVKRQATEETFTVYFLTESVRPGDKLREGDVRAEQVPIRFQKAFEYSVDEDYIKNHIGEPFQRAASMHQVLSPDLFATSAEDRVDSSIVLSSRRVPLRVNSKTLPGSLRPGMYVDIAAAFGSRNGTPNVLMVMERVQVRAMGQLSIADEADGDRSRKRITSYPTIEIDVTTEEALAFSKIEKIMTGDFEIYLRNPADGDTPQIPTGGVNPRVLEMIGQEL